MPSVLHLFESEQDAADERRRAQVERAHGQPRCRCCGRFAAEGDLHYGGAICSSCEDDTRPAIVQKVWQARRWREATR